MTAWCCSRSQVLDVVLALGDSSGARQRAAQFMRLPTREEDPAYAAAHSLQHSWHSSFVPECTRNRSKL